MRGTITRLSRLHDRLPARALHCRQCRYPVATDGAWGVAFFYDRGGRLLHRVCPACGRPFPRRYCRAFARAMLGCPSKHYIGIAPKV